MKTLFKFLFRLEHTIYCLTNCRVELPMHRRYYEYARICYEQTRPDYGIERHLV